MSTKVEIKSFDSAPLPQNQFIMPTSIITTDDLREFKMELLDDIKELLSKRSAGNLKKYLKSSEVIEMLRISPGTLQTLRIKRNITLYKNRGNTFLR